MNSKIRDIIALVSAVVILGSLSSFLARVKPIEVNLPQLSKEDIVAQEEIKQKQEQAAALQNKMRRIYACTLDEDCIIVDKDPCGCLIGPEGVTAINAMYTLEYNQLMSRSVTTTCPDITPSTERECSPSALPICMSNMCRIAY